jgi:multimeric flavodoxin WrbA
MTITVLGISGSPHRHGNTETLLDSFLDGARSGGAVVEKVVLRDIEYSACRGCNACHRDGNCIVKDDALPLFERMMAADCVAVASPIYSMGITAQLKGFIDRGQFLWARRFVIKNLEFSPGHLSRHKGIFISTAGQNWSHVFDGAYPSLTALFHDAGFEYYDNIVANNMDEYKGIKNHPVALNEAFQKGKNVVALLEKLNEQ